MRKNIIFMILSLFALGFFACQFNAPTAIEIIGSPSIRFAETVDIEKMFTDLLNDAINGDETNGMDIVSCTNTDIECVTYLIHMDLFDKSLTLDENAPELPEFPGIDLHDLFDDLVGDESIILEEDRDLINSGEPMILPFSSIGSRLNGFKFKDLETKLYFSGSDIISKLRIEIAVVELDENGLETDQQVYTTITGIQNMSSGYDSWKNGYSGTELPGGGSAVTLPMNGKDTAVYFKVIIPENTELELSDFQDGFIKVEVVVWLPFIFEAGDEGAEIAFPEDAFFDPEDDLFGRDEPDDENIIADIIESMSVDIKFHNSPFMGADLIVESKGIEIHNRVSNNTLSFTITEDDMKLINSPVNWPFTPNLKINYEPKKKLVFPKEFKVTEFSIKAKVRYKIDLQ